LFILKEQYMNTKMRKFADASMEKITSLENRLSGVLRPIKPRKEFVHEVAQRFQTRTQTAFVDRVAEWHLVAILTAGFISMAVFLAVLGRALITLHKKKPTV
jgi:ABC-type multidrug transport system fused ATPase/permease subunit